jgi:hypothetical protein
MPTLTLVLDNQPLAFELEKIDRTKLYGSREVLALDADGAVCERATLAGDGHTLAGKGDVALAYLTPDGAWRPKAELRAIDAAGQAILPHKPTFAVPVPLDTIASRDEYLGHTIGLVYQLVPADASRIGPLCEELASGTIFSIAFSYRGGINPPAGFVLAGQDDAIYLCVGRPCELEYVGLDAPAPLADEQADEETEDADLLDFSLV